MRISKVFSFINQLSFFFKINKVVLKRTMTPPTFIDNYDQSSFIYIHIFIYIYIATSKNPSVANVWTHSATNVITCTRLRLKQMWRLTKTKTEMKCEHWAKRWNWSSCTKLAPRASWTHGLITQSVRVSKRNSVVVGSNLTQANFL